VSANLGTLNAALSGRYTIERELGAGGMATVYLAHDVRHDRKVALKVLRPELSAILGAARFLTEIKTTANLQHPHILSLFDSGEADGTVFYVMPYIEGESLRDRIKRDHQLPVDEAVRIAREVADALEYAHKQGIVHRDIKPENILLHGGHAMVADFGIALAASRVEGGSRMTETGMSLGTPHYMSPEQAMGEREITPKADIYALGCVLYEMLTAEPPFVGATAQAIFARVLTDEPRSLTLQRKTIPPNVAEAVRVALQKLPADRFNSAAQFAEALGKADFTSLGTRARPAASATATPRQRALRLAPWALFAVAAVAAVAGWVRGAAPAVSRERIAIWDYAVPAGLVGGGLAISPDGNTIVYVDTGGGSQQLWAKERDQLEPRVLAGTVGAVGPVFSPDGEWIAFAAASKLRKVPRLGGSSIELAGDISGSRTAIAWLKSDTIVFNNIAWNLMAVHHDGGPARALKIIDGRSVATLAALPDGKAVLVGSCSGGCTASDLRVVDLQTGADEVLANEVINGWYAPTGHVVFVRRDGGVFAAPFDLGTRKFKSAAAPVFQGVRTAPNRADMTLSSSGTAIYAAGSAEAATKAELVWVSRAGIASPIESGWTFARSGNFGMSLSPDGRRIAMSVTASGSDDIWIKQLDRGPFERLTFAGTNIRPMWTADGRNVVYLSRADSGNEDVYAKRADGTGGSAKLLDMPRAIFEVLPTRDTMRMIVRYGVPPSRDIMLWQRGKDSAVSPLVVTQQYEETMPALSPDGRWIAYLSNESNRNEVYVRPFPNVNDGRWQVSRNGGGFPLWAHSGRELFFKAQGDSLMVVTLNPGPRFSTDEPRLLLRTTGLTLDGSTNRVYDIAPDDRRFVFIRLAGSAQGITASRPNLVRVDNWFTELGAKRRRP
jgi:serine/threonine-protein kinase